MPAASVATPVLIDLDSITVERARILAGRPVLASFIIAKPSYTLLGRTSPGAADRDDGAERGAVLRGKRLELREGERAKVLEECSSRPPSEIRNRISRCHIAPTVAKDHLHPVLSRALFDSVDQSHKVLVVHDGVRYFPTSMSKRLSPE